MIKYILSFFFIISFIFLVVYWVEFTVKLGVYGVVAFLTPFVAIFLSIIAISEHYEKNQFNQKK